MEINEQGKLVDETTIDKNILDKINLYTDIHLHYFRHPLEVDAIKILGTTIGPNGAKKLFQKYIYEHPIPSDEPITNKQLDLLLDSTRKELLNYLRNMT